jgi:hypothetical protein
MTLNNIERIDDDAGDFVVIDDYGIEGLSVSSQHKTLIEAISSLGQYGSPQAILKLVKFTVEEH